MYTEFCPDDTKVTYQPGDVGLDWRIILKWVSETESEDRDCLNLLQDKENLRVIMKTVVNLCAA